MGMLKIEQDVSNETAQNAAVEIGAFLEFENNRMAEGNGGQGHASASSGYVLLRRIRDQILREFERRAEKERQAKTARALRGPSIKERRGLVA